jgi:hypothetical protein
MRLVILLSVLVGSSCTPAWARRIANEGFEVGQRWTYRHEGPRPGSAEPNAIDGERILHVISVVEEQDGKQWVIEERFTNSKGVVRLYVNEERLLTAVAIENEKGEVAKLRYEPPVPYQIADLDVGKDRTIETALRMDSSKFALPSTIVIQRLEDETITTTAGEFVGCLHFKATINSTLDIKVTKIPVTEERERWYHPEVNGLVKEVYKKAPVEFRSLSREGYTATSVLTAFGRQAAGTEIGAIKADQGREDPNSPQSGVSSRTAVYLILLGALGVLAVAIPILIKRTRRK